MNRPEFVVGVPKQAGGKINATAQQEPLHHPYDERKRCRPYGEGIFVTLMINNLTFITLMMKMRLFVARMMKWLLVSCSV